MSAGQRAFSFAVPKAPAPLTRASAQAILEALRAASWCVEERGPMPSPGPVIVEPCREGVRVVWWGLRAEGHDEHEALAVLVRSQVASAREWAVSRRREARRLREAAKAAPILDARAARIEGELARIAPQVPEEPRLDMGADETGDTDDADWP